MILGGFRKGKYTVSCRRETKKPVCPGTAHLPTAFRQGAQGVLESPQARPAHLHDVCQQSLGWSGSNRGRGPCGACTTPAQAVGADPWLYGDDMGVSTGMISSKSQEEIEYIYQPYGEKECVESAGPVQAAILGDVHSEL